MLIALLISGVVPETVHAQRIEGGTVHVEVPPDQLPSPVTNRKDPLVPGYLQNSGDVLGDEDAGNRLFSLSPTPIVRPVDYVVSGPARTRFEENGSAQLEPLPVPERVLGTMSGEDSSNESGVVSEVARVKLSVSDVSVVFDSLLSVPQTETTAVTWLSENTHGMQLLAFQDDLMQSIQGRRIDQTTCNTATPCTYHRSGLWNTDSAYGFGYRTDGRFVAYDMVHQDWYRPFPLVFGMPHSTVIASYRGAQSPSETELTFKLNLPPSHQQGTYQSVVSIIALPKL